MAYASPIQTYYNGYRFRSRLEARWAVFFDAIGIDYEYEPEGFYLGDGIYYLPDFYLPDTNTWVEIKGREMSDDDYEKIMRFCEAKCDFITTGTKFRLLEGRIPIELETVFNVEGIFCYNYISANECEYFPYKQTLAEEPDIDISRGVLFKGVWTPPKRSRDDLIRGLYKARQSRFEHGERG